MCIVLVSSHIGPDGSQKSSGIEILTRCYKFGHQKLLNSCQTLSGFWRNTSGLRIPLMQVISFSNSLSNRVYTHNGRQNLWASICVRLCLWNAWPFVTFAQVIIYKGIYTFTKALSFRGTNRHWHPSQAIFQCPVGLDKQQSHKKTRVCQHVGK